MTKIDIDINSKRIIALEMQLNIASILSNIQKHWQEIDNVIHYNNKIYILQNSTLCNTVISQYYNNVFTGHSRKLKTAELMQ